MTPPPIEKPCEQHVTGDTIDPLAAKLIGSIGDRCITHTMTTTPDRPANNDDLAARARQLGTEHGQTAGETFSIPNAGAVVRVLEGGNLYIGYRVSQGVETSPMRMCQDLGISMQDSRMPGLWVEYGTSYNAAANTVVRRRAETMDIENQPAEEQPADVQRWDVQITVRGGEDIRHLIGPAMADLTQSLADHGVHAEITAFRPNGYAFDSWGSYPD